VESQAAPLNLCTSKAVCSHLYCCPRELALGRGAPCSGDAQDLPVHQGSVDIVGWLEAELERENKGHRRWTRGMMCRVNHFPPMIGRDLSRSGGLLDAM
jgi:hypothetical protein